MGRSSSQFGPAGSTIGCTDRVLSSGSKWASGRCEGWSASSKPGGWLRPGRSLRVGTDGRYTLRRRSIPTGSMRHRLWLRMGWWRQMIRNGFNPVVEIAVLLPVWTGFQRRDPTSSLRYQDAVVTSYCSNCQSLEPIWWSIWTAYEARGSSSPMVQYDSCDE